MEAHVICALSVSEAGDYPMDRVERLKEIISNYWHLSVDAIDWDMEFTGQKLKNFTSLRVLRFLATVEEYLNVSIEDPDGIKSFRDLLHLVVK